MAWTPIVINPQSAFTAYRHFRWYPRCDSVFFMILASCILFFAGNAGPDSAGIAQAGTLASSPARGVVFHSAAKAGILIIHGSSTFHKWSITTHDLSGSATIQLTRATRGGQQPVQLQKIHLTVNVLSLRGSDGSGMDKTIYHNLNSKHDPQIMYTLSRASLIATPASGNPHYYFKAHGMVTAAGVSKRITLVLAVLPLKAGGMTISTHISLTFQDFGISPPTAMLGIIRAGKHLKIAVTWNLVHKPVAVTPHVGGAK